MKCRISASVSVCLHKPFIASLPGLNTQLAPQSAKHALTSHTPHCYGTPVGDFCVQEGSTSRLGRLFHTELPETEQLALMEWWP